MPTARSILFGLAALAVAVQLALTGMILVSVMDKTVTVANPVDTVTIANPVETVTVANPVESVTVTGIDTVVQVAVPSEGAELYGSCFEQGTGYRLSITAVSGGIAQVVSEGTYTRGAAEQVGLYAASYYNGGGELDFGTQSAECSDLLGWR